MCWFTNKAGEKGLGASDSHILNPLYFNTSIVHNWQHSHKETII